MNEQNESETSALTTNQKEIKTHTLSEMEEKYIGKVGNNEGEEYE